MKQRTIKRLKVLLKLILLLGVPLSICMVCTHFHWLDVFHTACLAGCTFLLIWYKITN